MQPMNCNRTIWATIKQHRSDRKNQKMMTIDKYKLKYNYPAITIILTIYIRTIEANKFTSGYISFPC